MNEIMGLMDIGLKVTVIIAMWMIATGFVIWITSEPGKEVERIKKEYEANIKTKDEMIKDLKERLAFERSKHKEELKQYTKTTKMLKELNNALNAGAVKLKCPKHPDAEVTLLADGTIVCSKGHRIWPPEGPEGEGSE